MNALRSLSITALAALVFGMAGWVHAEEGSTSSPLIIQASTYAPIVIAGGDLPAFANVPISRIGVLTYRNNMLSAIQFQIDQRDQKGRFELSGKRDTQHSLLATNDECAFMSADAGERVEHPEILFAQQTVVEVAVADPQSGERKWVYLVDTRREQKQPVNSRSYVSYDDDKDVIETAVYKIGFSPAHPFLVDRMQWHTAQPEKWSGNVIDTMKIRHKGNLLGQPFVRTQADYQSRLVAVKKGPVRIIRRTLNSVHVLGFLKSPSISIDHIAFSNGFQMDTTVEFPFPLKWFFSDVKTYTTLDLNDDPALPVSRVYPNSASKGLVIDGTMSAEKEAFNQGGGKQFAIQNSYGLIMAQLSMEQDFPVRAGNFMLDDRSLPDEPESHPGQFGNTGFLSTNWEKVDTSPHHLLFNVLLLQKTSLEQGFRALAQIAPRKSLLWQVRH